MCSKYIYCTCICRKCIYCTDMRIDYVLCISSPGEELRVCTMYYRKNAHNQHQGVHGAAQGQCRQAPLAYQLLPPPSPSYTTSCYHTRELCFTARGFSARGEIPLNCSALTSHAGQAFNRPRPSLPPPHQTTVKHTRKASSCLNCPPPCPSAWPYRIPAAELRESQQEFCMVGRWRAYRALFRWRATVPSFCRGG